MSRIHCYLRTHRKKWGLSQKELAQLLGGSDGTSVSRLEQLRRNPSLRTAFAIEILFDVSLREMFPKLFARVEEQLLARAYELHEELQGNPSPTTRAKLDLLDQALLRARKRNGI